jgi:hypothetical protein
LNNFYNGALGIKLRENQLEIKTRLEGLSQHDHKWNDKGRMEVYSKCEFDIAAKDQFSFEILHKKKHEKWIPLHKRRSLAKIKTNGSIKIYPGFIKIDDGCSVEITRLKLEDQNGWTFCVEAYSRKKDIYDNFQEAMHFISNTFKKSDEILKPELSMGYPSWLRSLFITLFNHYHTLSFRKFFRKIRPLPFI